jgi:inhibitor of KinA sporulation pathway (predicted exonuclease)
LAAKLDYIIVVDVEATCWEGYPPTGQENEIIEVGLCILDLQSGQRITQQSMLVKPIKSEISPFCTELTTLTPTQVDQAGISFERACAIIQRKYAARDRVWASYGDYDRKQFEKQCQERHVGYPFGPTHINVKNLFALLCGLPREVGMLKAMEILKLPIEGIHHRGVDDAWNTALILSKLLSSRREELPIPPEMELNGE